MSRPSNPNDLFPSPDPSGDFGRDEGMLVYDILSQQKPDLPVEHLAERSVRIGMLVNDRFDIDPLRAAEAIVETLDGEIIDDSEK